MREKKGKNNSKTCNEKNAKKCDKKKVSDKRMVPKKRTQKMQIMNGERQGNKKVEPKTRGKE